MLTTAAGPGDVIRVGGPSLPRDPKVAIVASASPVAGDSFTVRSADGAVVLRGRVTRVAGTAAPWRYAGGVDLSGITAPGSYVIQVGPVQSPPWVVAPTAARTFVTDGLHFLWGNVDGNEPSWLHGPAHLHDARIASGWHAGSHVDLTGGFMDAGDMLHFTQTTSYVAVVLQLAAGLDPADAPDLHAAADVGVRWLVKAHPFPGTYIGQVGDDRDHDRPWGRPELDDLSHRPGIGTRLAYPTDASDIAGKTAAALALAARRTSGARHHLLLRQAKSWYRVGRRWHSTGAPLPGESYPGSSYADDLALGAAELWRATGARRFRRQAGFWLRQAGPSPTGYVLDWDDVGSLAAAELCGALGGGRAPGAVGIRACAALRQASLVTVRSAARDAFGMGGAVTWGTTATDAGGGVVTLLAGNRPTAAAARDFLLGRNPWGASFMVGYGTASPLHPHHWATSWGTLPYGAVVGGPARLSLLLKQGFHPTPGPYSVAGRTYEDRTADYVTSEPAIDYTATAVLLAAALSR
jgi:endoglucanase